MLKQFIEKLGKKIDILCFNTAKNSFGEEIKEYTFEKNNIGAIIQSSLLSRSSFSPGVKNISHIIKIPADIEIGENDTIRDQDGNNYIIKYIEEKIALNKENSHKKVYCSREV